MNFKFLANLGVAAALLAMGAALPGAARADETHFNLNVPAGGASVVINIPGGQTPVSVTCSATVSGDSGIGQATLLKTVPAAFVNWVGVDEASNQGTPKVSAGFGSAAGTHIIFCDFAGLIDIQLVNAAQIQVKNADNLAASVVLHFNY